MQKEAKKLWALLAIPIALVATMWLVEIIERWTGQRFTLYGIYPRDYTALTGIITSIFIHSDWEHLIGNSFPMLMLGVLMRYFYKEVFWPTYFIIIIFTGFLVWLFARESYHVGASGLIYGLISFIFGSGLFRKDARSMVLSLLIMVLYSGYFQGFNPEEGVSWESHLFGALVGVFTAFLFKSIALINLPFEAPPEEEKVQKSFFFVPDVFILTKEERRIRDLLASHEEE